MIQLVIFDLDGTLLNTIEDLHAAINVALAHFGYPEQDAIASKNFVGNGIYKLVERSLPQEARDEENVLRVKAVFDTYYKAHCQDLTKPYPGMIALLEQLNRTQISCGVVTNKAHEFAQNLIQHYFGDYVQLVFGQREGIPTKPHPQGVLEMLHAFDCQKEKCLFVGDSEVDIQTAQAAGIPSVGVLWGFRDESVLKKAGAHYLVADVKALGELILKG